MQQINKWSRCSKIYQHAIFQFLFQDNLTEATEEWYALKQLKSGVKLE